MNVSIRRALLWTTCLAAGFSSSAPAVQALAEQLPPRDPSDELAETIDRRIEAGWRSHGVEPAPPADDPEFLRRTYLNIAGRIPSVNEALEFLENPAPHKRRELVEELLQSPGYLSNLTSFWRDVIIPEANNSGDPADQRSGDIIQFEVWLRDRLERNEGFDRIAREVIAGVNERPGEGSTAAFVRLKDSKPENLAAGTARAFLGIRLECAQCHHHPFARWKRDDFWRFAAFFSGTTDSNGPSIAIPELDRQVAAAFLDGTSPAWRPGESPRLALAQWVTARENVDFARAAVNRLWAQFYGVGLVDPVDDFDERNRPSHPELLDELAHAFISHGYDQKYLIRGIARSRSYQLTSRRSHPSQEDPRLFARMAVKGLTSDQLFDSLIWATGIAEPQHDPRVFRIDGQREKFRELFGQGTSAPGEVQTSILQALLMLNGAYVDQATAPNRGRTLSAIIEAPFYTHEERLEILYLAVLARPPRPAEAAALLKYVEHPDADSDWKQALGDVYWALLNSSEFLLNH